MIRFLRIFVPIILIIAALYGYKSFDEHAKTQTLNDVANERLMALRGYQPIDPIQLTVNNKPNGINFKKILEQFPNEVSRVAIGRLNQNGSLSFGPLAIARRGESYTVIIDYIKYTTTSIPAEYKEASKVETLSEYISQSYPYYKRADAVADSLEKIPSIAGKKVKSIQHELRTNHGAVAGTTSETVSEYTYQRNDNQSIHQIKIPVYIGIGLRIQASITALKDSVNIGNLYGLGAAASQNEIMGTLIIQSIGISGENISGFIPIPDRINESAIQTAMQSLATIKSKIYDAKTIVNPQIVGFTLSYSVEGAKDLIEATLHTEPPVLNIDRRGVINFTTQELTKR